MFTNSDIVWDVDSPLIDVTKASKVKKIVISQGIVDIGYQPFGIDSSYDSKLINLESVSIPSSVTKIGPLAFSGLSKLSNVKISDGCKVIGGLRDCPLLTKIQLPSSVNEISDFAFASTSIESIDFSNITKIETCAFSGTKLKEADLSNVTTIGQNAFADCTELTKVILPDIPLTKDLYIFGNEDWGSSYLSNVNHIEYKGKIYTSVNDFYASL